MRTRSGRRLTIGALFSYTMLGVVWIVILPFRIIGALAALVWAALRIGFEDDLIDGRG